MRFLLAILMLIASSVGAATIYSLPYPPSHLGQFVILGNGQWKSMVLKDNAGNRVLLFAYDAHGNTNLVVLPSITYNDVASVQCFAVFGSKLYLAGGNGSSAPPYVWEWNLTDNGYVPTAASYVTKFQVGTLYPDFSTSTITISSLTNGGVGVFSYPVGDGFNGMGVYYRRPSDGVWTNMTAISGISSNNLPAPQLPARMTSAEDPEDHSLFMFMDKDSSGSIFAAKYVTVSNGTEGLYLVQTNYVVTSHMTGGIYDDDGMVPYGEFPAIQAVSDPYRHGILLTYPSVNYLSYWPAYYGDTPCVATLFSNNFTKVLINLSTNIFVQRLGAVYGSVISATTISYSIVAGDLYYFNQGLFPVMQQDIVNGVPSAPVIIDYQYDSTGGDAYGAPETVENDPYSHDIAYQNTNQVWKLITTTTRIIPPVHLTIGKSTVGKASM